MTEVLTIGIIVIAAILSGIMLFYAMYCAIDTQVEPRRPK